MRFRHLGVFKTVEQLVAAPGLSFKKADRMSALHKIDSILTK